jgi:transglutaminase-like putative cysteine protease
VEGASRQKNSHRLGSSPTRSLPYHPNFSGPVQVLTLDRPQPEDDESTTAQTIALMAELARQDSQHPIVRRAAYAAIAGAGSDARKEAEAIHQWIRNHVKFVEDSTLAGFSDDPENAEVLVRPIDLLTMPQPAGDCDDFSMLAAAMLRAVGIPAAFRTVAADGTPNYSHVYVLALLPDREPLPIDASHGPYAGWEANATGKQRTWPIDEQEATTMQQRNLAGLGFTVDDTTDTSGGGIDWTSIIDTGLNSAAKVLVPRYAVPQLNSGQYIQQGNQVMYQMPANSAGFFPGPAAGGSGTMLLLLALGLGLVVLMSSKN